jgi:hypothetical protein
MESFNVKQKIKSKYAAIRVERDASQVLYPIRREWIRTNRSASGAGVFLPPPGEVYTTAINSRAGQPVVQHWEFVAAALISNVAEFGKFDKKMRLSSFAGSFFFFLLHPLLFPSSSFQTIFRKCCSMQRYQSRRQRTKRPSLCIRSLSIWKMRTRNRRRNLRNQSRLHQWTLKERTRNRRLSLRIKLINQRRRLHQWRQRSRLQKLLICNRKLSKPRF